MLPCMRHALQHDAWRPLSCELSASCSCAPRESPSKPCGRGSTARICSSYRSCVAPPVPPSRRCSPHRSRRRRLHMPLSLGAHCGLRPTLRMRLRGSTNPTAQPLTRSPSPTRRRMWRSKTTATTGAACHSPAWRCAQCAPATFCGEAATPAPFAVYHAQRVGSVCMRARIAARALLGRCARCIAP